MEPWMVPVSFVSSKKTPDILLTKKNQKVPCSNSWIKLNHDETSVMRVQYSSELLQRLEKVTQKLSEEDRFGLIRDIFDLSEAGYNSTDQALRLATSLKKDKSYIVWSQIAGSVFSLHNVLFKESFYEDYKTYVLDLFSEVIEYVGWEKKAREDHSVTLLRGVAIGVMGRFGDKKTIDTAIKLFDLDRKNKRKLDSDLRGVVYMLVAQNSGEKEFDYFVKRYKEEEFQEEKDRLLRAICAFQQKDFIQKALVVS